MVSIYLSYLRGEKCKIYHVNLHYSQGNRAPFFYRMIKASLASYSAIPQVRIRTQITQYAECRQEQPSARHISSSILGAWREEEGKTCPVPFYSLRIYLLHTPAYARACEALRYLSFGFPAPSNLLAPRRARAGVRASLTRCKPHTAGITAVSGSSGAICIHKECKPAHAN